MLIEYFASVFAQEILEHLPDPRILFQGIGIGIQPSVYEIKNRQAELSPGKSPGVDLLYSVVSKKFSKLLNIDTSVIPDDWKLASVAAVHKIGAKNLLDNYRPICLTSHICNVTETVRDGIVEHLRRNKLIK